MEEYKYFHTYRSYAKGRWVGLNIVEMLADEFKSRSREYYIAALEKGVITVNQNIIDSSYIIGKNDSIEHTIHIHEPPQIEIKIIEEEEDYIVVNKPSGIPCHPTTEYNFFTVSRIFEKYGNISCINRLDVPTSGVVILSFKNQNKHHSLMMKREIKKIYLAKVKGEFPEHVEVNKKLKSLFGKYTVVSEEGKEALTRFRRLECKNGYSLVECMPETGRSHQIRVHLQSIGFPIVNDTLYETCTPKKYENVCKPTGCTVQDFNNEKMNFIIKNCRGNNTRAFRNRNSFLCLHAYKYYFNKKWYTADPPEWAILN